MRHKNSFFRQMIQLMDKFHLMEKNYKSLIEDLKEENLSLKDGFQIDVWAFIYSDKKP